MHQVQIIQETEIFINELSEKLKSDLLPDLVKNFQPREPEEYLTRKSLAKMLDVDLSTIHNYCKRGKLNPLGIGSRVYFRRSDVEKAFVELNK